MKRYIRDYGIALTIIISAHTIKLIAIVIILTTKVSISTPLHVSTSSDQLQTETL